MSNALLNAMVAVAMTATGLVAAFATAGNTSNTEFGDIPAITVYADRISIPQGGDIPDLIVMADRFGEILEGVEISYTKATADLPDLTVTVPRGDGGTRMATGDTSRSGS